MLVLVDAVNLAFRYVYNFSDLSRAPGHVISNIMEVVTSQRAEGVIIVWDGGSSKRREIFPDYKSIKVPVPEPSLVESANQDIDAETVMVTAEAVEEAKGHREKDPITIKAFHVLCDDLHVAFEQCGFLQVKVSDEEADDVIATLVRDILSEDAITVCSNDKDFYTLLSDRVQVWNWGEMRLAHWFRTEYGIAPEDWPKAKSLAGDASDNVPGVKGIGIKRAVKILQEGTYAEYEKREDVQLYRKVLEFRTVDSGVIANNLEMGMVDRARLMQMFEHCRVGGGKDKLTPALMDLNRTSRMRGWKLSTLESEMSHCEACDLHKKARNIVRWEGPPGGSDVLLVGEAPGEEEDSSGAPFCGRAGGILDHWLVAMGLNRNRVVISNVCWCFVDHQIKIYTSKGWKRIKDVHIGDLVLTHKGEFKKVIRLVRGRVERGTFAYNIVARVGMKKKQILRAITGEHPILTDRGWLAVTKLKKGDRIAVFSIDGSLKNYANTAYARRLKKLVDGTLVKLNKKRKGCKRSNYLTKKQIANHQASSQQANHKRKGKPMREFLDSEK